MSSGKYGSNAFAWDLSDWGRPLARAAASSLKERRVSVLMVTNLHLMISILSAGLIIDGHVVVGCVLLVVKGVIDAVDGELARIRERPSHVGRYWDTIADTIGLCFVMYAFGRYLDWGVLYTVCIVLAVLLQYSLFNHFSVRMRSFGSGQNISRVDERIRPIAKPWEKQSHVDLLHGIYLIGFSWQDGIVSSITGKRRRRVSFELTASSLLGYGFQSMMILVLGLTSNLEILDEILLYANGSVSVLVVLSSHISWRRSE